MKIIRQIVVSTEAPSTDVLWIKKGEARVYNNGTWQVVGSQEDIELPTWDTLEGKPEFAQVATSGNYKDLINTPTIPKPYVLPNPTKDAKGGVYKVSSIENLGEEATLETIKATLNELLTGLRTSGLLTQ